MKGEHSRKPGDSEQNESSMLDLWIEYYRLRAEGPSAQEMLRLVESMNRGFIAVDCHLLKQCFKPWRKRHPDPLAKICSRMEPEGERSLRERGWKEIMQRLDPNEFAYAEEFIHAVLRAENRYGKQLPSPAYLKRHFMPNSVPVLGPVRRFMKKLGKRQR